jgi:hypothetical protein
MNTIFPPDAQRMLIAALVLGGLLALFTYGF